MTDPSEVKISDAEVRAACEILKTRLEPGRSWKMAVQDALAAFLARRVPDAWKVTPTGAGGMSAAMLELEIRTETHNACRARVLAGL